MEMLCTIAIMVLFVGMFASGAAFAVNSYGDSMAQSQAQILCSTLRTAVADKLRYCGSVSEDGGKLFFQDIGTVEGDGKGECFHLNEAGQVIMDLDGKKKLLSSGAYPRGLVVEHISVVYQEEMGLFRVSFAIADSDGRSMASSEFDVRRINAP